MGMNGDCPWVCMVLSYMNCGKACQVGLGLGRGGDSGNSGKDFNT